MQNSLGLNKSPQETTVCVAMSGGVDSSVTAYLLQKEGYKVFGLTMDLLQPPYAPAVSSVADAAVVAAQLEILSICNPNLQPRSFNIFLTNT